MDPQDNESRPEGAAESDSRSGLLASRGLWIAVGAIVLFLAIVRVALPFVLARVAVDQAAAQGWQIEIGSVDLVLTTGHLGIDDVEIVPPGPKAWQPHRVGRAVVDISWRRTLFGERLVAIDDIRLERAELALERDEEGEWRGIPVFDEEESEPGSEDAGADPEEPASPWSIESTRIALIDAKLAFRDAPEARTVELALGDLSLGDCVLEGGESIEWSLGSVSLDGFDTRIRNAEEEPVEVAASGRGTRIESGEQSDGRIRLKLESGGGTIELDTAAAVSGPVEGAMLRWKQWPLGSLLIFSPSDLRAALRSGESDGDLRIDFDPDAALRIAGSVAVRNLDLKSAVDGGELAATWSALRTEIASLELSLAEGEDTAPVVDLSEVVLESPKIRWRMPPEGDSAAGDEKGGDANEGSDATSPRVRVAKLTVRSADVGVIDPSFEPPLPSRIDKIDIDAAGLRWPEQIIGSLEVAVASLGKKPLRVSANRDAETSALELEGEEISLSPVAPYLRREAGYELDSGRLSISTQLKGEGERFDAPTHLVLHDLSLEAEGATGSAFENLFGVPLDVALMLLRDSKGDIELDLDLEGDRDGAGVSLVDLTRQALQGAITGALASPLKVASALISDDGGRSSFRIEPVVFDAGSASIDGLGDEQLEAIDRLLAAEPSLGLRMEVRITAADAKELEVPVPAAGAQPGPELVSLAAERLEAVRERLLDNVDSLDGRPDRLVASPWSGTLAKGKGQVRGQLAVVDPPAGTP